MLSPGLFPAPRDGVAPTIPSPLACAVCGEHALEQPSPPDGAVVRGARLVCRVCGAHRLDAA